LYTSKEDRAEALKRHLEFFNTHPYVAAPIIGVTLALEEERANGVEEIDDQTIQGVNVGMMGPLAGVGDPVFWFTARPIIGALAASLAMTGSLLGPILFFVVWNVMRMAFLWGTQEIGYKQGRKITEDLSGGIIQTINKIASVLGMFVVGSLVARWVNVNFPLVVSKVKQSEGAFIDFSKFGDHVSGSQLQKVLQDQAGGVLLSDTKVTTLQDNLNILIPGFAALLITFLCMFLLKKKVSPIIIIFGLFAAGVILHVLGIM
jgi:PTS system mannose-specific IID component